MQTQSIGVDVGKTELVASIRDSNGNSAMPALFPNSILGFRKFIVYLKEKEITEDDPILFESTGPYHWQACRTLADLGYFVKVANPLHTKQIARLSIRKRKTDKVDSQNLAFLASQNYGYRFLETKEMARKKAMVRHYWYLRQTATDILRHDRYMKDYRDIKDESASKFLIKKCETLKKLIAKEWEKGNDVKYLDSIPGITPFLAATILSELLPLERFKTIDQIVAFSGLDPSVKQTGGKAGHHGHISKRGSPTLREALFLAAFGSFQREPMKSLYVKYKARGLHHNTILCILGRKILRIAVSLLKKRRVFDSKYLLSTDDDLTET
jgi:transposase